jgi:hypothetical protein
MNYQDIQRVNGEMKMLDLKGKDYAMVPERVTAFRKLYPEGFITTEILSHDGTVVTMQARVGYIREDGSRVILGTGLAQEVKGKGMVNSTSYIENCETSAVGRALGMLGLGINGGGICSAEELANAVIAQKQPDVPPKEEFSDMNAVRMNILEIVKGDMNALSQDIVKITGGKFTSLDGMNLQQLIAVQKIVAKKYASTEAKN